MSTAGQVADYAEDHDPATVAARRIYLANGFTLIGTEPHHSFGADLVGQGYEADLRSS